MKQMRLPILGIVAIALTGCSIGMAPKGPDANEVQQEFSKMPPDQQIKGIQHSPLPAAEKEKRIKEIEEKYGVSRSDEKTGLPPTGPATPSNSQ